MNIHVARTPPSRTVFTHTCCQGQTSGLTVRPVVARWLFWVTNLPLGMAPLRMSSLFCRDILRGFC